MFIDTHAHLNIMVNKKPEDLLRDFDLIEIETIVKSTEMHGISAIINVGTSVAESLNSIKIATRFKNIFAAVGIHPCDVDENWLEQIKKIEKMAENKEINKIVAIGETGLDYYHKPFNKQRQQDAFRAHIECALRNDLPVVVHIREAADDALSILAEYHKELRGVNHCFSQAQYVADQLIEWGFYLGIDAPITYPKNEWFREIVRDLPLESLVLETDSPFLPPQLYRGKQNKPDYIPLFASVIADLKKISLEDVGMVTSLNSKKLFRLPVEL